MHKTKFERGLERGLFAARWLMAPFYVGLVIAMGVVMVVFFQELAYQLPRVMDRNSRVEDVMVVALSLIDLCLIAGLLLIVALSGYETFIAHMDAVRADGRPAWLSRVDLSGVKMNLIASVVVLSTVTLLKTFMELADPDAPPGVRQDKLAWMVGLHALFLLTGLFLALTDVIRARTPEHH